MFRLKHKKQQRIHVIQLSTLTMEAALKRRQERLANEETAGKENQ